MLIVSAVVEQLSGQPSMVSRQSVTVWTMVCCIYIFASGRGVNREGVKVQQKTTNRFTVGPSEINNTEETLMVWTVLAQSKRDRHAKYYSYRVKPNAEQLFGCGVMVEKSFFFCLVREGSQI